MPDPLHELLDHTHEVLKAVRALYDLSRVKDPVADPGGWTAARMSWAFGRSLADLNAMNAKIQAATNRAPTRTYDGKPILIPVVQGEPAEGQPPLPVPLEWTNERLRAAGLDGIAEANEAWEAKLKAQAQAVRDGKLV